MAIDYAALASELNADPTGLGYAPLRNEGNDQGQADILNLKRAGISVFRSDIRRAEVIGALVATDYDGLTAARRDFMNAILLMDPVDATNVTLRANILATFANGTTTRANLITLASRQGSRAEQLFGSGVSVSNVDIARAYGRG